MQLIDVAIITCKTLPEPDVDEDILLAGLAARGLDAKMHPWDSGELPETRLAVIRSTWNYYHDRPRFLAWIDSAKTRTTLLNDAEIVHWNTDKSYLRVLHERGIKIVPTEFIVRDSEIDLGALMDENEWTDVVVKPRVSAGSFATERFKREALKGGELARAAASREVMVQPYVKGVDHRGERSQIAIERKITHSVRKSPRFAGGYEEAVPVPLDHVDTAFAMRVLDATVGDLLYARVDIARDEDNEPMLMELELVEPSLFFTHAPHALALFCDAIKRRVDAVQAVQAGHAAHAPHSKK